MKSTTGVPRPSDSKRFSKKDHVSWSKQLSKKDVKEKRRVDKTRKKAWKASTRLGEEHEEHAGHKRTRADSEEKTVDAAEASDNWASLAKEERLAKKLKKGKISQTEFDVMTLLDP